MLPLGTELPDFELTNAVDDAAVRSGDAAGPKGLLVMFICNHCPYVKHVMPGLEHGRVRELCVQLGNAAIGAVVVTAVRADRPVHPVHRATVVAHESPQAPGVEGERVEETDWRASGDPVELDLAPATLQLAHERAHELVTAARRRRNQLVEDGDVGPSPPRCEPVDLRTRAARDRGSRAPPDDDGCTHHGSRPHDAGP
jgi:hypothetical protein